MTLREKFLNACLECVGTKYHHLGRKMGVGLDCLGVPIYASKKVGIYKNGDCSDYSMMPDGKILLERLTNNLILKDKNDLKNGDILLMRFNKEPQHVAIYFKENGLEKIVHASYYHRKCTVEIYDQEYKNKTVFAFQFNDFDKE